MFRLHVEWVLTVSLFIAHILQYTSRIMMCLKIVVVWMNASC